MSNQIEQKLINWVTLEGRVWCLQTLFTCLHFLSWPREHWGLCRDRCVPAANPTAHFHAGNLFLIAEITFLPSWKKLPVNGLLPCARCCEIWGSSQDGDLLTQRWPWNCCPNRLREFWTRPPVPAGVWLQLSLQMMPWNWTICGWELIPSKSIIPAPWSCCFGDGRLASETQLSEIIPFPPLSETRFSIIIPADKTTVINSFLLHKIVTANF